MSRLNVGEKLGPYEILARIGAGGMGEVWKARDSRLDRIVAIKASKHGFSERFEREARAVAALNHPNICQVYDVGPDYLVMEYIEGNSPKGPLALADALRMARQIGEALAAAHEKGITHRDLKPANIKVKLDGTLKVLDFGLAKIGLAPAGNPEDSPTLTMGLTEAGMILGTASYMAPEQARGKETVDKRADIWAFGVVLYELLTGKRLFQGDDVGHTLASVIMQEPDLSAAPLEVRRLLKRCLEKDPRKRLRDIGDVWDLLDEKPSLDAGGPRSVPPAGSRWMWASTIAVAAIAAGLGFYIRPAPPAAEPVSFPIYPPEDTRFSGGPLVSPDGRKVAFVARGTKDSKARLWVRSLDSLEAKPVAELDLNPAPFWSADSHYIAFQAGKKLRKIDWSGGSSQVVCDLTGTFAGGAWSKEDGILVASEEPIGLMRVSASGGTPQPVTRTEPSRQENWHGNPQFLPDGHHFLYTRSSATNPDYTGVYVGSIDLAPDRQPVTRLLPGFAAYVPSSRGTSQGYLLFARDGTLMAQAFDPANSQLSGQPVPLANDLGGNDRGGNDRQVFSSASPSGVLAFWGSGAGSQQLTWVDREGKVLNTVGEATNDVDVALAPDAKQVATARSDSQGNVDLWLLDLARDSSSRFTFDAAADHSPVWSPDGKRIVFASNRGGSNNLYVKDVTNTTGEEVLLKSQDSVTPQDWSPDGRFLIYSVFDPKNSADIWVLSMDGEHKATPFVRTTFSEGQAQFSPDGHYVAYSSAESGEGEIYVRTFPDGAGKWLVSKGGGVEPRWRANGKELYYRSLGSQAIVAVETWTSPVFRAGTPKSLFVSTFAGAGSHARNPRWVPSPDGQRFLGMMAPADNLAAPFTVILNWQAGLRK